MQYQSFPGVRGDSLSFEKLKALRLPSLAGKRFLDVGCNEGFFCGYALHEGAREAVGLDRSRDAIARATERFPLGQFVCQSWDNLPVGQFDVILLASALHYANDQAALIHRLMDTLTDDGVLVLELGIAPSGKKEWVKATRSIDERLFPSRTQLQEVLAGYAWKMVGHSCNQAGDPIPRYVVHIRKLKPAVFLLTSRPGSGKSTLCRTAFANTALPVVSGDIVLGRIARGQQPASEALQQLVASSFDTTAIARVTAAIFDAGLGDELFAIWHVLGGDSHFVIDTYLTEAQEQALKTYLEQHGYLPVSLSWEMDVSMACEADALTRAASYEQSLIQTPPPDALTCFKVTLQPAGQTSTLLQRWHLDGPRQGQAVTDSVSISGWIMPHQRHQLAQTRVYLASASGQREFSLTLHRPDVLASLRLTQDDSSSPCGFRFSLPTNELLPGTELGIRIGDQRLPLAQISDERASYAAIVEPAQQRWQRWIKRLTRAQS